MKCFRGYCNKFILLFVLIGVSFSSRPCFADDNALLKKLEIQLLNLKRKTKDYFQLKKEYQLLDQKVKLVRFIQKNKVPWFMLLRKIATYSEEYDIWFSEFSIKRQNITRFQFQNGRIIPAQYSPVLYIKAYSPDESVNRLYLYRSGIVLLDWWKKHFLPEGLNDLNYTVQQNPIEKNSAPFFHSFQFQLQLKPKVYLNSFRKHQLLDFLKIFYPKKRLPRLPKKRVPTPSKTPIKERIKALKKQITLEEVKLKELEQLYSKILIGIREYHKSCIIIPDTPNLEKLSFFLRDLTNRLKMNPLSFTPKFIPIIEGVRKKKKAALFLGIEIPLEFETTYKKLWEMLKAIEEHPRLLEIKHLRIVTKGVKHFPSNMQQNIQLKVQLKLLAYRYNSEIVLQHVPQIQRPKKIMENSFLVLPRNLFEPRILDIAKIEQLLNANPEAFCKYYEQNSRCFLRNNLISSFCDLHFSFIDTISQQEGLLRKGKKLFLQIKGFCQQGKIKEAIIQEQILRKILRYPFQTEWIKIKIEDIRQDLDELMNQNNKIYQRNIFQELVTLKHLMLKSYQEKKFEECIAHYQELLLSLNLFENLSPEKEIQKVLNEANNLKIKSEIQLDFLSLPMKISAVIWFQKHPEESRCFIDGESKQIDDYVNYGARIVEIRKREVIFSYRGENIARKIAK